MCELSTALGSVLEMDMNSIASEFIKYKISVRDVLKITAYTEITTKELLICIITFEVEKVVKQGWYNSAGTR